MFYSQAGVVRTTAAAATLSLLLSACGGHGSSSPQSSLIPQAGTKHQAGHSIATSRERIKDVDDTKATLSLRSAVVGSAQPATADPPVSRPHTTPCIVQLYSGMTFTDFSQHLFNYTPPTQCPRPWSKVVFDGDFNVTAGRQFDRTASVWIAGTNIYFGTTAEPRATLSPSWHVERDVTELSPIFANASTGQAVLGNIVNSTYTGIISMSAKLEFYSAHRDGDEDRDDVDRVANVPDLVYPLSAGPLGDNVNLPDASSQLSRTFSFPRNVQRAYLEVFLQSQIGDEFWYTCVPNNLTSLLQSCGNTAFREGEVTIDGRPAGVAPVYPWIYTGGIDPYLWRPIPGVETFNFKPYRVNLTPFAGILDDGNQHTVAVSVFNDNNYFATNGALLLFLDREHSVLTGGILDNDTAASPSVSVNSGITTDSHGNTTGPLTVTAMHPVLVRGYIETPHGRITTEVHQSISFRNAQNFNITGSGSLYVQSIKQLTSITSEERTTRGDDTHRLVEKREWPLDLKYAFTVNPDGSANQTTTVHQGKSETLARYGGERSYFAELSNVVNTTDELRFDSSGNFLGPTNGKSSQHYTFHDNRDHEYDKRITSANYVLTSSH